MKMKKKKREKRGKNEKKRKIKYMRKIGRESSKKTIERFKKARVRRKISIIFFGVFL